MPRKHELDPNLPFELGLFFLVGRTDSRGHSNWGSVGGLPMLGGVLGVSGSQCQDQMVVLWVGAPKQLKLKLFLNRKSCLEKRITQQEVSFFRWVGDVLPAWKQHILEMAEPRVAGAVECWAECGQAVDGPGGPLEGD